MTDISRFLSPASFVLPRRPVGPAWSEHLPFLAWLVAAHRPACVLCLDAEDGAFAALCDAVAAAGLDCRALGVDPKVAAAPPGARSLRSANPDAPGPGRAPEWLDEHRAFAALLPVAMPDAVPPGSVDLLALPGAMDPHPWSVTLSPRAVVLRAGVALPDREPGARAGQQPASKSAPQAGSGRAAGQPSAPEAGPEPAPPDGAPTGPGQTFAFLHGGGLLVQAQPEAGPAVAALLEAGPELTAALRQAYARLGGHLTTRAQLRATRDALTAAAGRIGPAAPSALSALLPGQLAQAQAREAAATAHAYELQRALQVMRESTSWRLTAPLRALMHRAPGLRRRARGAARLGWWTLTLQLPSRLAAERGANALGHGPQSSRTRPGTTSALGALASGSAGAGAWPPALPLPLPAPPDRPPCAASVVVCVHNAPEDVERCLDSLAAHARPGTRLLLVDDGSDAPTRDLLAARAPLLDATLIRHDQALGYTRAANAGLRAANGEMVVLLNSDTVVTAGWLDALQRVLDRDPRVAIAGPLSNTASWQSVPLLSEEGPHGTDWAENPLPPGLDVEAMARLVAERPPLHPPLPFVNGFCLALRCTALDAIGLLDEAAFPTGYGEENDLCIRARKAGWTLRIAEDAYVWHAQSRSFSHERRLALSERAGATLAAKHDSARDIDRPAGFCRDSLALAGLRAWVGGRLLREQLIRAGSAHAGARIAFVLPVAAEGGGANVVLQEARALERMGMAVTLLNLRRNRPGALAAYPETAAQWTFLEDERAMAPLLLAGGFDAAIATAHQSAYWLPLQEELPSCRLAYYVQDYEPLFYDPLDPEHALARGSYLQDPRRALLTKTAWNRELLATELGVQASLLGPSLDVDRFRPVDRLPWDSEAATLRVCAMVRPSSARRAPDATWRLLAELSARHGRRVECHVFGADEVELAAYRVRFPGAVRNHGRLRRDQVAALFQAMDVFVDLSSYQAMGLTLLEAMASGLAVIGPQRGGAGELVQDGVDGFLVPTQSPDLAAALLDRMATDALDLAPIRRAAVSASSRHPPERSALALLEALFGVRTA